MPGFNMKIVRVTGLAGRGALLVEPIPSESEETE